MIYDKSIPEWRVIGKSVQGASHVRAALPNQDAIHWVPDSGEGPPLILAVSDGHGSAKCFRSHLGADLAVRVATTEMPHLLNSQLDVSNFSAIKRLTEERVPRRLVHAWQDTVAAHVAENPFTEEEWIWLVEKEGSAARQAVEANPALAYGATLLTVLVTEVFILYLQLGDGDILAVAETGEVSRPLRKDERLLANETTSLCLPNAWDEFRIGFWPLSDLSPVLILLATDGYSNSFLDEEGFLKVGSDILEMIRVDGLDKVNQNLEGWLTETSQKGSGDDITLGIVTRAQETNTDPIMQRMTALEKDIQEHKRQIAGRVSKLKWGVAVATFFAMVAFILAIVLWIRPTKIRAPEGLKSGTETSAETESNVFWPDWW